MSSVITFLRSMLIAGAAPSSSTGFQASPIAPIVSPQMGTGPTAAEYAAKDEIPEADLKSSIRAQRPKIVGPDTPEVPFPIELVGLVQRGFGRGSKDLGCPTGAF